MYKLPLNEKAAASVTAQLVSANDHIGQNYCLIVISVTEKENETHTPENLPGTFNMVERFDYKNTWEDTDIIEFATEKVNKRHT